MTTQDNAAQFEQAAQDSYAREMADVRQAYETLRTATDWEDAREQVDETNGTPLEVTTGQYVSILLTTGGPARGYYIFLDADNEPSGGCYWFQDWFTSKRMFSLSPEDAQQVCTVYDICTGE